jgi:hypothetical protein
MLVLVEHVTEFSRDKDGNNVTHALALHMRARQHRKPARPFHLKLKRVSGPWKVLSRIVPVTSLS